MGAEYRCLRPGDSRVNPPVLALEAPGWKLVFFTLLFLLCSSQLAVALMNWLSTFLVKPCLLPRLDFSAGIAPECRTMVVVPTMLTSSGGGRPAD